VGITLWVVSTGRYVPANFQTFTISGSELTWDWSQGSQGSSNYTTVRAQKEASFANAGWQIESSLNVSPYQVENLVLSRSAANDYVAPPAAADAGSGGASPTPDQVRMQDLATCFPGGTSAVRITRMRADLSRAALANDLVLQASADQSTMSNIYRVTQSVNAPVCPTYAPVTCPPCGGGSSGAGDDAGGGILIGAGDDGGGFSLGGGGGSPGGATGGGMMTNGTSTAHESFGCSAAPGDTRSGIELALAGLVGVSIVRSRMRKKK
jgi:hypothetical protein